MKTYDIIIAVDPSGNWNKNEKGGTGICSLTKNNIYPPLFDNTVWAKDSSSKEEYYEKIWEGIEGYLCSEEKHNKNVLVIIENFRLESGKASTQSNQELQTSELIGRLESVLDSKGIDHVRQMNTIKSRWPKKLLIEEIEDLFDIKNYKPSSRHAVDAVRHAINGYLKMLPKEEGGFGTPFKELNEG